MSDQTDAPAQKIGNGVAEDVKESILRDLVDAASYLHSGIALREFCKTVFGEEKAEGAIANRRKEQIAEGMNGGHGEGQARELMARAWNEFGAAGEQENALALDKIGKEKFVVSDWNTECSRVVQRSIWDQ